MFQLELLQVWNLHWRDYLIRNLEKLDLLGLILGDAKNTQDDHFYNDDSAKKDDEDTD